MRYHAEAGDSRRFQPPTPRFLFEASYAFHFAATTISLILSLRYAAAYAAAHFRR
jgi:hypothetical protein